MSAERQAALRTGLPQRMRAFVVDRWWRSSLSIAVTLKALPAVKAALRGRGTRRRHVSRTCPNHDGLPYAH